MNLRQLATACAEGMEKSPPEGEKASKPLGNAHFLYADFCACPMAGKWKNGRKSGRGVVIPVIILL